MSAKRRRPARAPARARAAPSAPLDLRRFVRGIALWFLPVLAVWILLTPFYNRFLTTAGENLVRLFERPAASRLAMPDRHHLVIVNQDLPVDDGRVGSVRVTDIHFPWLLLAAFFLAVPGVPLGKRLSDLGWASLASVFFHLLSLLFWVKFFYATQLGAWSAEHYGGFGENFWGLGKHLLDLPFKFAWPLALWCAFYLRLLLPRRQE